MAQNRNSSHYRVFSSSFNLTEVSQIGIFSVIDANYLSIPHQSDIASKILLDSLVYKSDDRMGEDSKYQNSKLGVLYSRLLMYSVKRMVYVSRE